MSEVGGGSTHGQRLSDGFVVVSTIALPATRDGIVIPNQTTATDNHMLSGQSLQPDNDSTEPDYIDVLAECNECDAARRVAGLRALSESPPRSEKELHVVRVDAPKARQIHLQPVERRESLEKQAQEQEKPEAANFVRAGCAYHPEYNDDDGMSDNSDSSSDIPAEVEDYFQQEREAFVVHERVVELDLERKETHAARDRERHLVNELGTVCQEFEIVYKRKRQELCEALAIAHYRLFITRNACLAQNIDPERFRYRRV